LLSRHTTIEQEIVYGATCGLQVAHTVLGENTMVDMLAKNKSLLVYSNSLSGGPPKYNRISKIRDRRVRINLGII
jgi:hypothetical protein